MIIDNEAEHYTLLHDIKKLNNKRAILEHKQKEMHHGIHLDHELKQVALKQLKQLKNNNGAPAALDMVELTRVRVLVYTEDAYILRAKKEIAFLRHEIMELMKQL